jgi:hypothetical protein
MMEQMQKALIKMLQQLMMMEVVVEVKMVVDLME